MRIVANLCLLIGAMQLLSAEAFLSPNQARDTCPLKSASDNHSDFVDRSRRDSFAFIMSTAIGGAAVLSSPATALAAADCMKDCLKNCLIIAPKVSSVRFPAKDQIKQDNCIRF